MALRKLILVALVSLNSVSCVAVSMHSTRNAEVTVIETDSNKPAQNKDLEIAYTYDSYGLFFFLNAPDRFTAKTDSKGQVAVPLANFRYSTNIRVDLGRWRPLPKKVVLEGGTLLHPTLDPKYRIEVSPSNPTEQD